MKKILILLIATAISLTMLAQNENDALRYSLINYSGTARFSGMSGAYGAVGADFSSLSQNPAGIGLYRKSEFSITPVLTTGNTRSEYFSNQNTDFRTTLYLGNIGYVMALKLNENNGSHLKMVQFGFGMNRMAMFNNRMIVDGLNTQNSLMLQYRDDADFSGPNPDDLLANFGFGAGLAYDAMLLYQDTNNIWQVDLPGGGMQQTKTIETRGGTSETVLSTGTNFDDKLFLGVTFGFPRINYEEESVYTEKDDNYLSDYLKSFERTEYLHTKGNGFNFKFGFIYKPVDFLRIGGAIHTPTYYDLNDSYNATMTSYFDKAPLSNSPATRFEAKSKDGSYDYKINTPFRASGSVAIIIGQHGLISADYEYIDYSTARLRPIKDNSQEATPYEFLNENNVIRTTLTTANNIRIGTEWKAGVYALRGGYNLYGSPYKGENTNGLGSRTGYSFGFGIREKAYFIDFAFNHMNSKDNYYIYGYAPASQNDYKSNSYSFTIGFRL